MLIYLEVKRRMSFYKQQNTSSMHDTSMPITKLAYNKVLHSLFSH